MRQRLTVILACALALLAGAGSLHADPGSAPEPPAGTPSAEEAPAPVNLLVVERLIKRHSRATWHWQRVMGVRLTRELKSPPANPLRRLDAWERIAAHTWRRAQNPPHKRQWLCIQRFEAAWNDPSPPYYGGLQMDLQFQRTYGAELLRRKGTADNWSPLEQMWTAERAHRSGRGFYPWPNTARSCGLI